MESKALIFMILVLVLGSLCALWSNSIASSTMVFEGQLTDNGNGTYSGTLQMQPGYYYVPGGPGAAIYTNGGFDIFAKEGGSAYYDNVVQGVIGADHDAYGSAGGWGDIYDPDCADDEDYTLVLTSNHWSLIHANAGVPMGGAMDWDNLLATETDTGEYLPGTGTPQHPGYAAANGGGPGAWDMDWSWGSEAIPLEYSSYWVKIVNLGGSNYRVTFEPDVEGTIAEQDWYVPSSQLSLGSYMDPHPGALATGYQISAPYQINMLYQAGILDKDITNINTYMFPADENYPADHVNGSWTMNYSDNEDYVFSFDVDGGLPVYTYTDDYPSIVPVYTPGIQWTLTGWGQTILAGDIIEQGGNTYFRVYPEATYRPFAGDLHVNNVEVFDGNIKTEVEGYTFTGALSAVGTGSVLTCGIAQGLPSFPVYNVNQDTYYLSIQTAIDDADAGDVINVAAGTYMEQLHIDTEDLTINGEEQRDPVIIKSPATLTEYFDSGDNDNYPVVFVDGVQEFTLTNVTVDGDFKGNANYRFVGIGFWNAGGTVENVNVINIMDNPFSGSQHGVGIYAYNDTPGTYYTITLNTVWVEDFQKTGVALNGNSASQNLTVDLDYVTTIGQGPTETTAQNGIQVWDCTGTVDNCTVEGVYYTGAGWTASGMIISNCEDLDATGNIITDSQTAIFSQYNTGVGLYSNQISGDCDYGIYDYLSTGMIADGNQVTGIPYATWFSPGATITDNILTDNDYAIILDVGAGYTVTGNSFTDNYVHVYVYGTGTEPDVTTMITTNTYDNYLVLDQVVYGNASTVYVEAPRQLIKDDYTQTYSVIASHADDLRGFEVVLKILKEDFAEPTNFVIGSLFSDLDDYPGGTVLNASSSESDDDYWIVRVGGTYLDQLPGIVGDDVVLFTFSMTSMPGASAPAGSLVDLPLDEVELRDQTNGDIECPGTMGKLIYIDSAEPEPIVWVKCRTLEESNNKIDLAWTNPTDAYKNHIWRLDYDILAGANPYPTYNPRSFSVPAIPAVGTANGWVLVETVDAAETYVDDSMARGYYYYAVYVEDEAGNVSGNPVSGLFYRESISYWPGDVPSYVDGQVDMDDVNLLSLAWGQVTGGPHWNQFVDIGPSTDSARRSRPCPDGRINIEDMMMFAMNYLNTDYTIYPRDTELQEPPAVTIAADANYSSDQLTVNLRLGDNAGAVRGLSLPLAFGSGLELQSVTAGDIWPEDSILLHTNADNVVEVSASVMGGNATLPGNGCVATLVFDIVGEDRAISLNGLVARDVDNRDIVVTEVPGTVSNDDLINQIPAENFLGRNYPNPFTGSTTLNYGLKEAGSVRILIYNNRGQLVRSLVNDAKAAGSYRAVWDGKDSRGQLVSSGVYFIRMEAVGYVKTNKALLIK